MKDAAGSVTRRTLVIVLAVSAVVWAMGLMINALPSEDLHDRYWYLFVAPSMIGFIVGVMALTALAVTYLPRHRR